MDPPERMGLGVHLEVRGADDPLARHQLNFQFLFSTPAQLLKV